MNVNLEVGAFDYAVRAEFHKNLFGQNCVYERFNVKAKIAEIRQFFSHLTAHQSDKNDHMFHSTDVLVECGASVTGQHMTVTVQGTPDEVGKVVSAVREKFESCDSYVRWVHDPQYLTSMNVPLPDKNPPFEEMYPWLNGESLESYYNRFITSSCSILLLIGAPGTGKTSFLRDFLRKTKSNAIVSYHPKVIENETFFAEWYESTDEHVVIAEDADDILSPRSDGNKVMQRFLNLSDGLVSMPHKKIIFTCNLENLSDIDSALTRPGRCFDVVHFAKLDRTQSKIVAEKAGIDFNLDGNEFTVSEIFNEKTKSSVKTLKNKFGFL